MAFSHGSKAKVLLDGFNASNYVKEVSFEGERDTAEITVLGDTAKSYMPGLEDATVSFEGFYDYELADPTLAFSHKLNSLHATITQATYMPTGDTLSAPAFLVQGFLTSDSQETSVDDAVVEEFEIQNNTGVMNGIVLHPLAGRTTTGNGTGVDNGALTSNGAQAVLHVTAVSGTSTPTITVVLEHSVDNTTYVPLISFAAKTAKGSEYKTATGTVNRWLRVKWTITGTTPSMTIHVAAQRA